jgi:hypothetical protein
MNSSPPDPIEVLSGFRLPTDLPVYQLGLFERGITVYRQQRRALNLAWSLVESHEIRPDGKAVKVAIIGGGVSGLTLAAALMKKQVCASITLFEQHDTVLPLQYGCDTRWLHPRIYDWPLPGSTRGNAELPVLNWRAGRASEVVTEILIGWREIVELIKRQDPPKTSIEVFCNTHHLRVLLGEDTKRLRLEWIGEPRCPEDPSLPPQLKASLPPESTARRPPESEASLAPQRGAIPAVAPPAGPKGSIDQFDHVILAIGFGLENEYRPSYWRNETLAQPHLVHARETYIVSGGGDSAMIDLLRLRIAHFRQDRILSELFDEHPNVKEKLRTELGKLPRVEDVNFDWLTKQLFDKDVKHDVDEILVRLRARLRNDTLVILHRKPDSEFTDMFEYPGASVHNRVLVFLLFYCGGFSPSERNIRDLTEEYHVPDDRIIRRYGTNRAQQLAKLLSPKLLQYFETGELESGLSKPNELIMQKYIDHLLESESLLGKQLHDAPINIAGFFEVEGIERGYVPDVMQWMARALCSQVVDLIQMSATKNSIPFKRAKVQGTLLRSWKRQQLQQCCNFVLARGPSDNSAGRLYARNRGVMGLAYARRRVIRSKLGASANDVRRDLEKLGSPTLLEPDRHEWIASLAMIPIVRKITAAHHNEGPAVLGVLGMVSDQQDAFSDDIVRATIAICTAFVGVIDSIAQEPDSADVSTPSDVENIDAEDQDDTDLEPMRDEDWQSLYPNLEEWGSEEALPQSDVRVLNLDVVE